ncbi:MAG: hypothetical protein A2Z34_05850 [Planctomycetes bacterium RBG_16_59_8]|nr:MAG: hypothetical protein A2Z34_05850 [Planctomycetes bacterium RBG_16_59_8]
MNNDRRTQSRFLLLEPILFFAFLFPRPLLCMLNGILAAIASLFLETPRRLLRNFGLCLIDTLSFACSSSSGVRRLVRNAEGLDQLRSAAAKGNGVILITPHMGNWELGGIYLSSLGFPMTVLTLTDDDPRTNRFREKLRRRHGIETVEIAGEEKGMTMLRIVAALREGRIVAMLTDRESSDFAVELSFLGGKKRLPAGPALLSILTGAPIVPSFCLLNDDGSYTLLAERMIEPPAEGDRRSKIEGMTREWAGRFERRIEAHHDQWFSFASAR